MSFKAIYFRMGLVLLISFVFTSCLSNKTHALKESGYEVCLDEACFETEVAMTRTERSLGLMHRPSMKWSDAMLFPFDEVSDHVIWMKNVQISLDILWLNEERVIQFIHSEAVPCRDLPCPTYTSPFESKYVLELRGGSVKKFDLRLGQQLKPNAALLQALEKKA